MDLLITLDKSAKEPIYEQLYDGIKRSIISQQLSKGAKLPSKRQLAEFLSISQTTVELAYGQLLAEGYTTSVSRVGFFVEDIQELPFIEQSLNQPIPTVETEQPIRYNFSPSKIDAASFPFSTWRKYAKLVMDESSMELLQTGHSQGEVDLRVEIAHYLYQSRGIECIPEQIVIGSGTEHLLPMILRLFDDNSKLALENPGYAAIPIAHLNEQAVPISIDADGLIIEQLEKSDANIVYLTPAHQFPTGAVLSASRRTQLLNWASEQANRYILEDDYDSEFRYIGKPIAALQSMDRSGKVIYLSTFTKSLMPSLRVAYFVLPKALMQVYTERLSYYSSTVPRFEQHILAHFMRDGHFSKHLNRMRKIYRKKHDKIIQVFTNHYPKIQITGDEAGMHFLISFTTTKSEATLLQDARNSGIHILSVSNYTFTSIKPVTPTFLLGFGGLDLDEIEDAVHALMNAFTQ